MPAPERLSRGPAKLRRVLPHAVMLVASLLLYWAATRIEPGEQKAVLLSFLFVFLLMSAYFILRPVRNAMASDAQREAAAENRP